MIYIGNSAGDIGDILSRENCGVAFCPGDSEKLAENLKRLMNDSDLIQKMGKNARAVFDRCFDKRFGLEKWQKILK